MFVNSDVFKNQYTKKSFLTVLTFDWTYNHMLFIFQLEEKLLQFHLGNLEFSCAAPLNKVSSLSWDQNEAFPQFSGDHTLLQNGFGVLLKNLAQGLDITFNCEVCGFVTFPVSLQC